MVWNPKSITIIIPWRLDVFAVVFYFFYITLKRRNFHFGIRIFVTVLIGFGVIHKKTGVDRRRERMGCLSWCVFHKKRRLNCRQAFLMVDGYESSVRSCQALGLADSSHASFENTSYHIYIKNTTTPWRRWTELQFGRIFILLFFTKTCKRSKDILTISNIYRAYVKPQTKLLRKGVSYFCL